MEYFPVREEVYQISGYAAIVIGLILSIIVFRRKKKSKIILICLSVYALCEMVSVIRMPVFAKLIVRLLDHTVLGGAIGTGVVWIVCKLRKRAPKGLGLN